MTRQLWLKIYLNRHSFNHTLITIGLVDGNLRPTTNFFSGTKDAKKSKFSAQLDWRATGQLTTLVVDRQESKYKISPKSIFPPLGNLEL